METNQPVENEPAGQIAAYNDEIASIQREGHELVVKKARNALFWAAGLIFFGELLTMLRDSEGFDPVTFFMALAISGIFIGLALWTKKKPYTAIIVGIIVFIGYWALGIISYGIILGAEGIGRAIIGGIIIRIVILINLIRPLKDAKELQELMEQST